MLLLEQKLLFIHIPKCAGTSLEVFFAGRDWTDINAQTKHITARQAVKLYGRDTWDSCFTFTVVRNPWARFLSFFHLVKVVKPRIEFDPWIRRVCKGSAFNFRGLRIDQSMTDYLVGPDGKLMVDFVGKVESLPQDFKTIAERAGVNAGALPHTMAVKYEHDYRKWYTPETRDLVAAHFRDDVERFGYDY